MAAIKENLGKIPCPACGDQVAVYRSATNKLSYTCQHPDCESTGYANPHTGAAKKWLSQLPKAVASKPEQKPEPKAAAKQETKPKAAEGFGLGL